MREGTSTVDVVVRSLSTRPILLVCLLVGIVWNLYGRTLSYSLANLDDARLLKDDSAFLKSPSALADSFRRGLFPRDRNQPNYYRPLVTASFVIDASHAKPDDWRAFHATNVALHLVVCVLVFALARSAGLGNIAAFLVALLFGVHPAATEVVGWIPARGDSLLAVFGLGFLLSWLRYERKASLGALIVHIAMLAGALLAKESGAVFPVLAVGWSLLAGNPRALRSMYPWLGWIACVAAWAVVRELVLEGGGETNAGGAHATAAFTNVPMLLAYYGKLLAPFRPAVVATQADTSWVVGLGCLLVAAHVCWLVQGQARRAACWAMFVVPGAMLAPGLAVSDFLILENRLYVPLASVVMGLGIAVDDIAKNDDRARALAGTFALAVCIFCAAFSSVYVADFSDAHAFASNAARTSPNLARGHLLLGVAEYKNRNYEASARALRQAQRLNDTELAVHNNLGLLHLQRKELEHAEREFRTEIRHHPDYSKAHVNLARTLLKRGDHEGARASFELAAELDPKNVNVLGELFTYWAKAGDNSRAVAYMKRMEALGARFEEMPAIDD